MHVIESWLIFAHGPRVDSVTGNRGAEAGSRPFVCKLREHLCVRLLPGVLKIYVSVVSDWALLIVMLAKDRYVYVV